MVRAWVSQVLNQSLTKALTETTDSPWGGPRDGDIANISIFSHLEIQKSRPRS